MRKRMVLLIMLFTVTMLVGYKSGRHNGWLEGYEIGYEIGCEDGNDAGYTEGWQDGRDTQLLYSVFRKRNNPVENQDMEEVEEMMNSFYWYTFYEIPTKKQAKHLLELVDKYAFP